MTTRKDFISISVVEIERHQEMIQVKCCGLKPLRHQDVDENYLLLRNRNMLWERDLTRLETHVYRKTTDTLIVAKTINVWAETQQTARDNGSAAKQLWVLNGGWHKMSKVLFCIVDTAVEILFVLKKMYTFHIYVYLQLVLMFWSLITDYILKVLSILGVKVFCWC